MINVGVDIDGVCCESAQYFNDIISSGLGFPYTADGCQFRNDIISQKINEILSVPDPAYLHLLWKRNARQVLTILANHCNVEFITARPVSQQEFTYSWLSSLPFEVKLTMAPYSSKLADGKHCNVFIDDRLDYLLELCKYCDFCFWFTEETSIELPDNIFVVSSWIEIMKLFLQIYSGDNMLNKKAENVVEILVDSSFNNPEFEFIGSGTLKGGELEDAIQLLGDLLLAEQVIDRPVTNTDIQNVISQIVKENDLSDTNKTGFNRNIDADIEEDLDGTEVLEEYMSTNDLSDFYSLTTLAHDLGYSSFDHFIDDNSGAVEAVVNFVSEYISSEWEEFLKSSFDFNPDSDMDVFEQYISNNSLQNFRSLVSLAQDLGYSNTDYFFDDNPGAIEAVVNFIYEYISPEWEESLREALGDNDRTASTEKTAKFSFSGDLNTQWGWERVGGGGVKLNHMNILKDEASTQIRSQMGEGDTEGNLASVVDDVEYAGYWEIK